MPKKPSSWPEPVYGFLLKSGRIAPLAFPSVAQAMENVFHALGCDIIQVRVTPVYKAGKLVKVTDHSKLLARATMRKKPK